MAEIQTKTEAVIHLDSGEVAEIRGWLGAIDWAAHPLAEEIYAGLGGDPDAPYGVTASADYGLVIFTKEA